MEILIQELMGDIGMAIQLIERNGLMTFIMTAGAEPEPSRAVLDWVILGPNDLTHIMVSDLMTPYPAMVLVGWGATLPVSVRPVISVSSTIKRIPVEPRRQPLKHVDIVAVNACKTVALNSILAVREPGTGICNLMKPEAVLVRRTGIMGCGLQREQGAECI